MSLQKQAASEESADAVDAMEDLIEDAGLHELDAILRCWSNSKFGKAILDRFIDSNRRPLATKQGATFRWGKDRFRGTASSREDDGIESLNIRIPNDGYEYRRAFKCHSEEYIRRHKSNTWVRLPAKYYASFHTVKALAERILGAGGSRVVPYMFYNYECQVLDIRVRDPKTSFDLVICYHFGWPENGGEWEDS